MRASMRVAAYHASQCILHANPPAKLLHGCEATGGAGGCPGKHYLLLLVFVCADPRVHSRRAHTSY